MARQKRSKQSSGKPDRPAAKEPAATSEAVSYGEQVVFGASSLSLHDLFQQQAMRMLDRADISEEQKQEILVAMACPCCGAGAMSYTVRLKK